MPEKIIKDANPFIEELKKFIGQEIEVTDTTMNKFEGTCKAISFNHLNVIIMTKTEKIVIKNISFIKRKRTGG